MACPQWHTMRSKSGPGGGGRAAGCGWGGSWAARGARGREVALKGTAYLSAVHEKGAPSRTRVLCMPEPLNKVVEAGWADALEPVADQITRMGAFLRAEIAAGRRYLPAGENVLRAFSQPFDDVRVLIMGQDPYPTPGHPVGLSFSVDPGVRRLPRLAAEHLPRVLAGPGLPDAGHGRPDPVDRAGRAAAQPGADGPAGQARQPSRQGLGRGHRAGDPRPRRADKPLVAILWGRDARNLAPMLGNTPIIESAHPSPMSAHSGFFGTRPFSRASQLLETGGAAPVDWKLP